MKNISLLTAALASTIKRSGVRTRKFGNSRFKMSPVKMFIVVAILIQLMLLVVFGVISYVNRPKTKVIVRTEIRYVEKIVQVPITFTEKEYVIDYNEWAIKTAKLKINKKEIPAEGTIRNQCGKYGIRADLVLAIANLESEFNPREVNPESDATGMMQVMRGTYYDMKIKHKDFKSDMLNPDFNVETGTKVIHTYLKENKGDITKALYHYGGCASAKGKRKYMRQLNNSFKALYGYSFDKVKHDIAREWLLKNDRV